MLLKDQWRIVFWWDGSNISEIEIIEKQQKFKKNATFAKI